MNYQNWPVDISRIKSQPTTHRTFTRPTSKLLAQIKDIVQLLLTHFTFLHPTLILIYLHVYCAYKKCVFCTFYIYSMIFFFGFLKSKQRTFQVQENNTLFLRQSFLFHIPFIYGVLLFFLWIFVSFVPIEAQIINELVKQSGHWSYSRSNEEFFVHSCVFIFPLTCG